MSEIGQRQPRERDEKFLAFVRLKPCVCCGAPAPNDAAHIRMASGEYGKRYTGKGEKPSDRWALPLCRSCHSAQHATAEPTFWARAGKNPFTIAMELYRIFQETIGSAPTTRKPRRRSKLRFTGSRKIQNGKTTWAKRSFPRNIKRKLNGEVVRLHDARSTAFAD